uniref:Uncharacterized protein n=1 Tax=Anguilla anguilla TaxID=7936 RepID=A0A0E9UUT4_ANGAN
MCIISIAKLKFTNSTTTFWLAGPL